MHRRRTDPIANAGELLGRVALSITETGYTLGCGETTTRKLMRSGELEYFYIGKSRRILLASIKAYTERQRAAVRSPGFKPTFIPPWLKKPPAEPVEIAPRINLVRSSPPRMTEEVEA